jgi:phosphonate transport system substrate-binding protein
MVKVTDEPVVAVAAFHTHSYVSLTIVDLQGEQMCYVESLSTSGYIVPSIMLMAAGVDPFADADIVGSHSGVIEALYNRECEGGATYFDARVLFDGYPEGEPGYENVYDIVLPLELSPQIPNDGFSFARHVPEDQQDAVVLALLDISETPEGLELLGIISGGSQGLVQTDHSIYSGLEDLIANAGLSASEVWENYYH